MKDWVLGPKTLVVSMVDKSWGDRGVLGRLFILSSPCAATASARSNFKIHPSKEKGCADKAWCDYSHKQLARRSDQYVTASLDLL